MFVVELKNTPTNNNSCSYIDTRTISKSKSTKKKFKIGEEPLIETNKKVNDIDVESYKKARKKRFKGLR